MQKTLNEKAMLAEEKSNMDQEIRMLRFRTTETTYQKRNVCQFTLMVLLEIAQIYTKFAELRIELSSMVVTWKTEKLNLKDEDARQQLTAEEQEGQLHLYQG